MKRRAFLIGVGGVVTAWPSLPGAQQAMPVIGFLSSRTAKQAEYLIASLRDGLKELGYLEGQNVALEYRFAEGQYDRLPGLAADLVSRRVDVIVAGGTPGPAIAATRTIPVIFTTGFDPVAVGYVGNLARPEGNVTGATFYSGVLSGKQMEVLKELAPATTTIGLLIKSNTTAAAYQVRDAQSAANRIGIEFRALSVDTEADFEGTFAQLAKSAKAAVIVSVDPYLDSRNDLLVALAARYSIPCVYYLRESTQHGGLASYGASITDTYRQAGVYAGRLLRGARPADLPVQLPTRFELAVNLKTAKSLGVVVPATLLARADEVIE